MEQPLILELAKKYGKTPAQIAVRHGLQRGLCVIFKSKTPTRLAENLQVKNSRLFLPLWIIHRDCRFLFSLQVFDFELAKEDMKRLEELGGGTRVLKGAA